MPTTPEIERNHQQASQRYAESGVDTGKALELLSRTRLSIHCWQGDDVGGFERPDAHLSGGGIQVTGNYPGKARTVDELRHDLDTAFSLIPGTHRLNLHAIYGEFGGAHVDRNAIEPRHFQGWIDWAEQRGLGLDFNATCFSHPMASSGCTLSDLRGDVREFWIEHVRRCRRIAAFMGKALGTPSMHNLWIPDGAKDTTVYRFEHRRLLKESLDIIYGDTFERSSMKDSVESKLFGIGSESFVVGSHEVYLGYAMAKGLIPCLDMGHFHPTESVADKVSSLLLFFPELLVHVSRGIRWDSDHVVVLSDGLRELMQEIARAGCVDRVNLALDYFDASMNRVGAWVVGARATLKALLIALLEPVERIRACEREGNSFARLALLEEAAALPWGAVWEYHCLRAGVPSGTAWIDEIGRYEDAVLSRRS
jgi:L-rhamnose isomerase